MDGKSMFGDIKSKLGFGRKNGYEEFYEDYEEFEEGDDYGEYGYDESYERTSGSAYDPYDSVTTREPGERSRGRSSMPRLVSIDDVRARTAVPTLPDDDAPASRRGSSSSFRTMVDSSLPPQMTPEGTAAASAAASAASRPLRGFELTVRIHHAPGRYAPGKLARHFCLRFRFALHPLSHAEGGGSRRLQRRRGRLHGAQARQCGGAEFGGHSRCAGQAHPGLLLRRGQRAGCERGMCGQQGVRPHSHRRAHRGRALLPAHSGYHLALGAPLRPSD